MNYLLVIIIVLLVIIILELGEIHCNITDLKQRINELEETIRGVAQ